MQALFSRLFQASEGKHEAIEERQTRGIGKGAFHYRFVLYSPEKGEEIAFTFSQFKSFIESHKNKSKRTLCTLCGFVECETLLDNLFKFSMNQ